MTPREAAYLFHEIQTLLDLHGADEFRSRAYGRAARALETAGSLDLREVIASGNVSSIAGIGKGLAPELSEIVTSGTSSQLEELRAITPPGLLEMLKIRGLGAKKVRSIHLSLGITTLASLEEACRANRVASLPGFGGKSQANILEGLEELRRNRGRVRIDVADQIATTLRDAFIEFCGVRRCQIAGRLRRGGEDFDRLSLVAVADPESLAAALRSETFIGDLRVDRDSVRGMTPEGLPVAIHCTDDQGFAIALFQHTGSSDHLMMVGIALERQGLVLDEQGLHDADESIPVAAEEDIYRHAGLPFIVPELREGIDEVPCGIEGRLPRALAIDDLRGMIHVHSTWSDGRNTIDELARYVQHLGYRYLLITDHSKAAFYANGLDEKRLKEQGREIDELNSQFDPEAFVILKGIECDILADGSLDLADDALAALDAVIVSIHSRFDLPRQAQTERIVRALEHPSTTILGHPTGRLILGRKGYEIDHRLVIDTAARLGAGIEINANPRRLDLSWRMVRYAVSKSVPIAIAPDAHALEHFDYMRYGVMIARKGGLASDLTINTMSPDELRGLRRTRLALSSRISNHQPSQGQ